MLSMFSKFDTIKLNLQKSTFYQTSTTAFWCVLGDPDTGPSICKWQLQASPLKIWYIPQQILINVINYLFFMTALF